LVRILLEVGIEQITARAQRHTIEIQVKIGLAIQALVTISARLWYRHHPGRQVRPQWRLGATVGVAAGLE
ncbi:hypothetical protein B8W90_14440, partial [Staphylococcus hominis]